MPTPVLEHYLRDLGHLLKLEAIEAAAKRNAASEVERPFLEGFSLAYINVLNLMLAQARPSKLPQAFSILAILIPTACTSLKKHMNPIWFGLFTVTGPKDNAMLDGDAGACLWIAAQAEDGAKLRTRVEYVMRELGLTVVDGEQLQEVLNEDDLSEEVWKLIPQARRDVESVVCGTWHKFIHHDA